MDQINIFDQLDILKAINVLAQSCTTTVSSLSNLKKKRMALANKMQSHGLASIKKYENKFVRTKSIV